MSTSIRSNADVFSFLYSRINYERQSDVPYQEDRFRLVTMRRLLKLLGDPQNEYAIVHVAGTKGKGSTGAMIGSILTASGRKTGVYSSPHLHRLEERFCIDGQQSKTDQLLKPLQTISTAVEQIDRLASSDDNQLNRPTFFEVTTALAMLYFAENGVSCAVVEVGLGGRLDSTNVCQPQVSVITSISYDHTQHLGNSLSEIAGEKAGIIKENTPVVSGVVREEAATVIEKIAAQRSAPLLRLNQEICYQPVGASGDASTEFSVQVKLNEQIQTFNSLKIPLLGEHQRQNAALAVATVSWLDTLNEANADRQRDSKGTSQKSPARIGVETIRKGLLQVESAGRIEIVNRAPLVICDIAHNGASIEALLETLQNEFGNRPRTILFATSRDKKYPEMLEQLMHACDHLILTRFLRNPRAVDPKVLEEVACSILEKNKDRERNIRELSRDSAEAQTSLANFVVEDDPHLAWVRAKQTMADDTITCICGSAFIVGELREVLIEELK